MDAKPESGSIFKAAVCRHCGGVVARGDSEPWHHMLTGSVSCDVKVAACKACGDLIIRLDRWRHRDSGRAKCGT